MKKLIFTALLLISFATITKAQATNPAMTEHDPSIRVKDSLIKVEIITPARKAASPGDPDWDALTKAITAKYDAITADRTVCKAKIYYYYSRDKAVFCTNIIHYTDAYELANDYKLLNLNAEMILQSDDNAAELKEALRWAKAAADSDSSNDKYKATYEALQQKVNPQ